MSTSLGDILAVHERRIIQQTAFRSTVNREHPMGAARLVRRERYAWPGGYPLALLLVDGALLCPDCVAKEWHLLSAAHHSADNAGGWRPAAMIIIDAPETDEICAHCEKIIAEGFGS